MKKFFICFLIAVLAVILPVSACADGNEFITDRSGILQESEIETLEEQAESICSEYGCGVYVIAVDDYSDYSSSAGIYYAACDLYDSNHLGCGSSRNGILLLISVDTREYAFCTTGEAKNILSDSALRYTESRMTDYLGDDNWYRGISAFVSGCESLLADASENTGTDAASSYTYYSSYSSKFDGTAILVILGISMAAAGVTCGIFASQMKTAKEQKTAGNYIPASGIVFTVREDRFTHRTVTRQHIDRDSGGHGGPGGPGGGHGGHGGRF